MKNTDLAEESTTFSRSHLVTLHMASRLYKNHSQISPKLDIIVLKE